MMCKKLMFNYYWENLKADISRSLLSDKKNIEIAKQISVQIFAVNDSKRQLYG